MNEFSYNSFNTFLKFPDPTPEEVRKMCVKVLDEVMTKVSDYLATTMVLPNKSRVMAQQNKRKLANYYRALLNHDVEKQFDIYFPFVGKGPHWRVFWTADKSTIYISGVYHDHQKTYAVEAVEM
jgi:hypothetical protein